MISAFIFVNHLKKIDEWNILNMKGVSGMGDKKIIEPIVSPNELFAKKVRFSTSREALRDVIPPKWSEDEVIGKKRVIVGTKDEVE